MKKILIVCFGFPPFPGIGGRRWAKFAKELASRNNKIFVLSSENPFPNQVSLWTKDVTDNPNISLIPLPLNYPKYLLVTPKNFFQKVAYRISLTWLKLTTKGNYYDRAVNWKNQIQNVASKIIIKEQINNVIVTGAPFQLIHHVVDLKKTFPGIRIIADFRDLWTAYPLYMGFSLLSEKRKNYEINLENEIINSADFITSVSEEILQEYVNRVPQRKNSFLLIENGYDPDEITKGSILKNKNQKIKLIFAGTLYQNIEYIFEPFINALIKLKNENRALYELFEMEFYGEFPTQYKQLINKNNIEIIKTHNSIGLNEIQNKIAQADLGMLFLINDVNFSLSTKFFEYILANKKIVVFTSPGKTSDFIVKNKLGYAANPSTIYETLKLIFEDFKSNNLELNSSFDVEQYSIKQLTNKIENLLQ